MPAFDLSQLSPASFRDIAFGVESSQRSGGRRNHTHEYPGRDEAYVEDLGRKVRTFILDAFLVGADYLVRRRQLEDALEQAGPGRLIHPYYGDRLVAVTGEFTIQEEKGKNGYAKFSITFTETAASAFSPVATTSPLAQTQQSADGARVSIVKSFGFFQTSLPLTGASSVSLPGMATKPLPWFTFSRITGLLSDTTGALHNVLRPVANGEQALASIKRNIDLFTSQASSLIRDPIALATSFGTLLTQLRETPRTPRLGLSAMLDAYGFTPSTPRPTGATVTQQVAAANYDATLAMVQQAILVEAVDFAAQTADIQTSAADARASDTGGFATYEEAITVRDTLLEALDDQLETADDENFAALSQLRADVARAVPGATHQLPRLTAVTPAGTVSSLVLAYQLYGDVDRSDDLEARNTLRYPGFIPGGVPLQVLSRV